MALALRYPFQRLTPAVSMSLKADASAIARQSPTPIARSVFTRRGPCEATNLPVTQPIKFEPIINLKTAKTLDIPVPVRPSQNE